MTVSITIRNVPDEARDRLVARAANAGQSLQEHLRAELLDLARHPTVAEVIDRAQERKAATASRLGREQMVSHRDADRR